MPERALRSWSLRDKCVTGGGVPDSGCAAVPISLLDSLAQLSFPEAAGVRAERASHSTGDSTDTSG